MSAIDTSPTNTTATRPMFWSWTSNTLTFEVLPPQNRAPRGTYWRRQRAGLIGRAGWRTRRVRGHVGLVDALPRPDRGRPRARVASKPRPVGLVRLRERVRWAA